MKALLTAAAIALVPASAALAADPVNGEAKFNLWCVACHGAGPGHPGTQALQKAYADDPSMPAEIALRTDLDADIIEHFIRNGTSIMPFFRKTELSDSDIADIAAYISLNAAK